MSSRQEGERGSAATRTSTLTPFPSVPGARTMGVREDAVASRPVAVLPARGRLAHLDRLKILLTAGVITAHAAMSYGAAGTWVYEQDSLSKPTEIVLSVLVGGGVLFVLGLFFLMSGMLTTGPLGRRGPRRFLVSRLWRLGVPVLAYAVLVWPLLQWLIEKVQSGAPAPWTFYRREFSGARWPALGTGPMWFVAILLVVTVGWCLWRWRFPGFTVDHLGTRHRGHRRRRGRRRDLLRAHQVPDRLTPSPRRPRVDLAPVGNPLRARRRRRGAGWISPVPHSVLMRGRQAALGAVLLLVVLVALSAVPSTSRVAGTGRPLAWRYAKGRSP